MNTENISTNKELPFFSVVIPVYNKEPHIARCISSVINQTFTKLELIIICDPSTDNSNAEVEVFSDSRIRVFYRDQPGPGGYAARNLGIIEARTDWIAFLDADDEWYPEYLDSVYRAIISSNNPSFIGSGWNIFDPIMLTKIIPNKYYINNHKKGNHFINFKEYLHYDLNTSRPFYTSSAVVKKELLLNGGLFPEGKAQRGGDIDTWLRCIFLSKGVTVNDFIGACYYRDSINMVTKNSIDDASAIRKTISELIILSHDRETIKLLKKLSNYYSKSAWSFNFYSTKYEQNFKLFKALYYDVNTLESFIYGAVSLLPEKSILILRNLNNKFKRVVKL